MNKEEILAKSRKEKKDEGVEYAMNRGRRIGTAGMAIMFLILLIYNFIKGLDNYAVFAMFWTYIGFESYGKYSVTKQKSILVGAIAGIIAGILFLANYIISTMR